MKLTRKMFCRFWDKVDKSGDCWEWTASKTSKGYGTFHTNERNVRAHRFSYFLANGHIEKGMHICHTCDNPGCVNPAHLFEGTPADNMADRDVKGRNGSAKLSEADVLEIRELAASGMLQAEIARKFSCSQAVVSKIAWGKSWKHVGGPRKFYYNSTLS
tara:strand:+ start:4929 stop:5405 length:477 start_codon:yes stop_codon:yes gene_type:complete